MIIVLENDFVSFYQQDEVQIPSTFAGHRGTDFDFFQQSIGIVSEAIADVHF